MMDLGPIWPDTPGVCHESPCPCTWPDPIPEPIEGPPDLRRIWDGQVCGVLDAGPPDPDWTPPLAPDYKAMHRAYDARLEADYWTVRETLLPWEDVGPATRTWMLGDLPF